MIIPFKAASHLNAQVCLLVSSTLPRLQNINIQFFVGHPSHFHFIYPTVSLCSEIKLIDEAQVSNIPKYLTNSFVSTTKKREKKLKRNLIFEHVKQGGFASVIEAQE